MNFFLLYFLSFIFSLTTFGCTSHSFDTKNYEDSLYNVLVVPTPRGNFQDSSTNVLGQVIESAMGIGAKIPPGAYADYGSLLHVQGKHKKAIASWGKEIEVHPESKKFLSQLISEYYPDFPLDNLSKQSPKEETLSRRQSILIWPPFNQTQQPFAAGAFHATISGPLTKRGYYVFPIVTTHTYLKKLGLLENQTMTSETLEKIQNKIGADAILAITVTDWVKPKNFLGFPGRSVNVSAEYRLIEVPTGKDLWRESLRNEVNEQVTGGAGGPIMAIANDHRVPARFLNKRAIRSFSSDLLHMSKPFSATD